MADKLFAWVSKFKAIGDIVVQYDPGHAALPWAGFRFLLQVTVDDSQKMGALLVGLETVANIMGRCAIYEQLYSGTGFTSTKGFEDELTGLYVCILEYLVEAIKYYSKKTGGRDNIYTAALDRGLTF